MAILIKVFFAPVKTIINLKNMLLTMRKVTLPNGLQIIHELKKGNSVVVQVMVKTGSNYEAEDERGISHFLEHILFEGTTKRPTNREISNEIEKIGGDFNAYTTNERTCFYVKVLKKHFHKAVEILADIFHNPLFKEEHITKERNIVLKEIDMVLDEPSYYQWILLQKHLFKEHPCKYPVYGNKTVIRTLTRKKIIDYFEKYYLPNNMTISVVGDVKQWKEEIKHHFWQKEPQSVKKPVLPLEPVATKKNLTREKKDIVNTYTILGFKTVPRKHKDSAALEVINGILGRGQSGKMFTEIRSRRGLAYDVGTQNVGEVNFGYFAIYATIDKKNVVLVRNLILEELQKLQDISEKELKEAKDFVEGHYLLEMEDSQKIADQLLFWEHVGSAQMMKEFVKRIRDVSVNDIQKIVSKYFINYTGVVLEGK